MRKLGRSSRRAETETSTPSLLVFQNCQPLGNGWVEPPHDDSSFWWGEPRIWVESLAWLELLCTYWKQVRARTSPLAFVSYQLQHWHGAMVTSRWGTAILIESLECRSRNNLFHSIGPGSSFHSLSWSRGLTLASSLPRSLRAPGMEGALRRLLDCFSNSATGWAGTFHVDMQMRRTHQRLCMSIHMVRSRGQSVSMTVFFPLIGRYLTESSAGPTHTVRPEQSSTANASRMKLGQDTYRNVAHK